MPDPESGCDRCAECAVKLERIPNVNVFGCLFQSCPSNSVLSESSSANSPIHFKTWSVVSKHIAPRNVLLVAIDFGADRSLTGSSSTPLAALWTHNVFFSSLPNAINKLFRSALAKPPMVVTPKTSESSSPKLPPRPRMRSMGKCSNREGVNDSSKIVQQFGLFMPLVSFANILFDETPQDKVYPRLTKQSSLATLHTYAPAIFNFSLWDHSDNGRLSQDFDASSCGGGSPAFLSTCSSFSLSSLSVLLLLILVLLLASISSTAPLRKSLCDAYVTTTSCCPLLPSDNDALILFFSFLLRSLASHSNAPAT